MTDTTELPAPASEDMDKRLQQYITVRDAIKRLDENHNNARKNLLDLQERVGGKIRAFMDANKLENLKTEHGTAYTTTVFSASVADPDLFMRYVIEHKEFDLLDRRANKTAVVAFVKEHKGLPPGVNLNSVQNLGVRRKGSDKD
jgi:hypothetical protein